jgi:hypothetical protein
MPAAKDTAKERSLSGDFDESDDASHADINDNHPGKPGRKKNPNSQAARRDQNRIAQREFRLRKQQRIRDLEARVELLSGGKDEAMSEMRNILKDLMQENQTLRNLLRGVSAFIGEGAGGLLPKMGWDMADFTNFVNRSETDTAWESHQIRKKAAASSGSGTSQKRPATDDPNGSAKKARSSTDQDKDAERDSYSLPLDQVVPPLPTSIYSADARPPHDNSSIFSTLMRGSTASPMFMNPSPPSSGVSGFSADYPGLPAINVETSIPPAQFPASTSSSTLVTQRVTEPLSDQAADDDTKKDEALKFIHYHLDNYKRNSQYCLPASLRPTSVQREINHESLIDCILHPELRDRMIHLRGRFDLAECLFEYKDAVTIHGDDVLTHTNWEISEFWLRKYEFLIDQATLNVSNRWRRERGETELRLSDLAPADRATSLK